MRTPRTIRISLAGSAALAVLVAGCGSSDNSADQDDTSDAPSAVAPVPPSPVQTEKKVGGAVTATLESEAAFVDTLQADPCSQTLTAGVQAILQNYAQIRGIGTADVDPSGISVTGTVGTSPVGLPQCTYTISGAGPITTAQVATVTAAENAPQPGRPQVDDVIAENKGQQPPGAGPQAGPVCQSTNDFLHRVQELGGSPYKRSSYLYKTDPAVGLNPDGGPDELVGTTPGTTMVRFAYTDQDAVFTQTRCEQDTSKIAREPGNSPDWSVQMAASQALDTKGDQWKAMRDVGQAIGAWMSGGEITPDYVTTPRR